MLLETRIRLNVRFKTYENHIYKWSQDFNSEDLDRGRKKHIYLKRKQSPKLCFAKKSGMKFTGPEAPSKTKSYGRKIHS